MNLCYLYENNIKYPNTSELFNAFESVEKIDFSAIDSLKDHSVYIVEVETLTKETTSKIRKLFSEINTPIYFIAVGSMNALLYQLAYILQVKSIITLKQDIQKVIKKYHKHLYHPFTGTKKSLCWKVHL